ncbi:ATP-binding protein [Streptomyces sp. NPDC059788]|uniref:ATP-binding protein n=1 Tax=Streptomyces sp. NPDC059788 TaxID=3346948 RepID=UPI00366095BC
MSDRAAHAVAPSDFAGTEAPLRLPPARSAAALAAAAVGSGWLVDTLGLLPGTGSVVISCTAAAGVLGWTAVRTRETATRAKELRAERDAAQKRVSELLHSLDGVMPLIEGGRAHVQWALEQASHGTVRVDYEPPRVKPRTGDIIVDLKAALERASTEAWQAVLTTAAHTHQQLSPQAELAELFNSIAPRLQGLVNRAIQDIEKVERPLEDPDLLHGLYGIDHLLTQMRRLVESLLVLGGNLPARDCEAVPLMQALRRAASGTHDYARVRIAQAPVSTAVLGYVSPNLVHLLAALMENATRFSTERVEVHTRQTKDGVVIRVIDSGTGMSPGKYETLNRLLTAPEAEDPRVRLRKGTLGLLVAALLAQRHRITIELRPNITDGTQAIVVLPAALLAEAPTPARNESRGLPARAEQRPALPGAASSAGHPEEQPRNTPAPQEQAAPPRPLSDGRPALPRRDVSAAAAPATRPPQEPHGQPTGGLMASFTSRTPRTPQPEPPEAPAAEPETSDTPAPHPMQEDHRAR